MSWTIGVDTPHYCPLCATSLTPKSTDAGPRPHCPSCELTMYRNPVPMGRATVVDGDSALLIERGRGGDVGSWALAGGHIEFDESPRVAAARELEEETGLVVNPDDLELVGDGFLDFGDGYTMVSFNYAAPHSAAEGVVEAADDAADARFWSREELLENTPLLRASGLEQVLDAIVSVGRE